MLDFLKYHKNFVKIAKMLGNFTKITKNVEKSIPTNIKKFSKIS